MRCLQSELTRSRAQDPPSDLTGDHSYLTFNPKSQNDLVDAVLKVNPETQAMLFGPGSQLLDSALRQNGSDGLSQLLNDVFANKLSATGSSVSSTDPTNQTLIGNPRDPTISTKSDTWGALFFQYRLTQRLATRSVILNMAILMLNQLQADIAAHHATPETPHPGVFRWSAIFHASQNFVSWNFQALEQLTYNDLFEFIKIFGQWANEWDSAQSTAALVVPGCFIDFSKKNQGRATNIGPAIFVIRDLPQRRGLASL